MRSLAIGDIHGCRTALETLISFVNPTTDDQFIFLGDYVNRGPDSRGVIEFLIDLKKSRRCIFLRGNHEIMTLEARQDRTRSSTMNLGLGADLLRSYRFAGQAHWWALIPDEHWQFLEQTERYFETDRHIFVHGALDAEMDMPEQPDWIIFWERFDTIRPHKSGKKIMRSYPFARW
jgi:serine/threonine protein phosphatase 1